MNHKYREIDELKRQIYSNFDRLELLPSDSDEYREVYYENEDLIKRTLYLLGF